MLNWIIGLLARLGGSWRSMAIKSLQQQLTAAKAERARFENNYLVLADDHADLRAAYDRLAFERLQAWGLDRADGGEHPEQAKGLAGHRRRSAPLSGGQ